MPEKTWDDGKRDKLIEALIRTCVENDAWIVGLKELLIQKGLISEEEFVAYRTAAATAQTELLLERAVESRKKAISELLANYEGPIH